MELRIGEHRAYLELDDQAHYEVYRYAKSKGLDFIETLCAKGCLSLLKLFTPDKLKVASRDLTNLPLLEAMAETRIPIILSTGMAGKKSWIMPWILLLSIMITLLFCIVFHNTLQHLII